MRLTVFVDSDVDDIWNQRHKTKDDERDKGDNTIPKRRGIINDQTKFFKHHNVDKCLGIGGI